MVNKSFVNAFSRVNQVLLPARQYIKEGSITKDESLYKAIKVLIKETGYFKIDPYYLIALKVWIENELHLSNYSFEMLFSEIHKVNSNSKESQGMDSSFSFPHFDEEQEELVETLEVIGLEEFIEELITEGQGYLLHNQSYKQGAECLEGAGVLGSAKAYIYLVQHFLSMDQELLKREKINLQKILDYLLSGSKFSSSEGNQCNAMLASIYSGLYSHIAEKDVKKAREYWRIYLENMNFSIISSGDGPFIADFILSSWAMDKTVLLSEFKNRINWLKYELFQYLAYIFEQNEKENSQDEMVYFYKKMYNYLLVTYHFDNDYIINNFRFELPLRRIFKKGHQVEITVNDIEGILKPGTIVNMLTQEFNYKGVIRNIERSSDEEVILMLDISGSNKEFLHEKINEYYPQVLKREVFIKVMGEI